MNYTEAYLLLKNNLTYIYPLKLQGSSGKPVFKIIDVSAQYYNPIDGTYTARPDVVDTENGVDIFFNLNMKPDLFKVKSPQGMSKQQISEHFKQSILGNEKITVKNISLIRQHKRTFKIANIGTFPAEIKSVTLGNHGASHNGFSIKKVGDSYEIQYEPDFRRSKVTETILVKTKYSITEFKVQAYIPVYLIKFIDTHFRLTEIEDAIGNWYYLIILSFVLLTLLLLGTELVEYIIFLKQKSINYSLITEVSSTFV